MTTVVQLKKFQLPEVIKDYLMQQLHLRDGRTRLSTHQTKIERFEEALGGENIGPISMHFIDPLFANCFVQMSAKEIFSKGLNGRNVEIIDWIKEGRPVNIEYFKSTGIARKARLGRVTA